MEKYIVVSTCVNIPSGVIGLNEEQYESRKHKLNKMPSKGMYEITNTIQLKKGETFGFEGEMNKVLASDVELALINNEQSHTIDTGVDVGKRNKKR
ncbi:MAG: hypothetical protein E3K37_01305 [Candidatus Kuenenia sp.]|nr:hypothetical protein [Candidatus Kuenenia hertensis]